MRFKFIIVVFLVFQFIGINGQIAKVIESIDADSIYQLLANLEGNTVQGVYFFGAFQIGQ